MKRINPLKTENLHQREPSRMAEAKNVKPVGSGLL
jgi:hypothetical protein